MNSALKEAQYYEQLADGEVLCNLCPHNCNISPSRTGICGVRRNDGGTLHSLNYGKVIAANPDPIEKKPLFHVFPGTSAFSIATAGCNLSCKHCQNAHISQVEGNVRGRDLPPSQVVEAAARAGCEGIAYTYTEPTIFFEYAYDTAEIAADRGLYNVFVTNGYVERGPVMEVSEYLDACNVDLKSFQDRFYRDVTGGSLEPVLDTIRLINELDIWLEITTLIIPGLNDSEEELRDIASFIADLDSSVPWHITGFRPAHKMTDRRPTSVEMLRKAKQIGQEEGLRFLYQGNIPGEGESTYCPECGKQLISRYGFRLEEYRIKEGNCPDCGESVPGLWDR
ncbi:MAG: AmmeMemoRadiSam system radical SAM enzyme [Candidatus Acetothermia bacterium]